MVNRLNAVVVIFSENPCPYTCSIMNPLRIKKKSTIRYNLLIMSDCSGLTSGLFIRLQWKITVNNAAMPRSGVKLVKYVAGFMYFKVNNRLKAW